MFYCSLMILLTSIAIPTFAQEPDSDIGTDRAAQNATEGDVPQPRDTDTVRPAAKVNPEGDELPPKSARLRLTRKNGYYLDETSSETTQTVRE